MDQYQNVGQKYKHTQGGGWNGARLKLWSRILVLYKHNLLNFILSV